jgi:hypothetical protein
MNILEWNFDRFEISAASRQEQISNSCFVPSLNPASDRCPLRRACRHTASVPVNLKIYPVFCCGSLIAADSRCRPPETPFKVSKHRIYSICCSCGIWRGRGGLFWINEHLVSVTFAQSTLCPSSYKMEHQSGLSIGGSVEKVAESATTSRRSPRRSDWHALAHPD